MWIFIGIGLAIGGYVVYTHMKIKEVRIELATTLDKYNQEALNKLKEIENLVDTFPTPTELAKEILKIKVPLSELPKDMADKIKSMNNAPFSMDDMSSGESAMPDEEFNKKGRSNYIG